MNSKRVKTSDNHRLLIKFSYKINLKGSDKSVALHWIIFMTSLYMYYALSFVLVEHSVCHAPIFVSINVFTLLL